MTTSANDSHRQPPGADGLIAITDPAALAAFFLADDRRNRTVSALRDMVRALLDAEPTEQPVESEGAA